VRHPLWSALNEIMPRKTRRPVRARESDRISEAFWTAVAATEPKFRTRSESAAMRM
jgi:hypothetical protein